MLAEQKGIIRSNCIDCLDRTNGTQSYLGRVSLNSQLQRVGALSEAESISSLLKILKFTTIYGLEQGDELSLEYSGPHALKGDLVKYGKQTMAGVIKDGLSALSRYYLNNFQDGDRQDATDLICGNYSVNKNSPSPFQPNRFEKLTYLPVASALLIGGLTVTSITFTQAGQRTQSPVSSVIRAGATAGKDGTYEI